MKAIKLKSKIIGSKDRPRVSVSKSNKYIYAQIIDDENQKTLISGNDKKIKKPKKLTKDNGSISTKVQKAHDLGIELAKKAKTKKITAVVFDRGNYRYHGRVKALAEGLREGGLKF